MSHLSYMEKLLDGVEVEWKPLGEVARFINGRAYKKPELLEQGKYPVLRVGNFFTNANWYYSDLELDEDKYCDNGDLLYAWSASFGPRIWEGGKVIYHYHIWKVIPNAGQILKKFLFYLLEWDTKALQGEHATGSTMMHVSKGAIESRLVPIPCPDNPKKSLAIQAEIVRILDAFTAMTAELTAELNMRKKQYNYYRDQLLGFDEGEVEWKTLLEVCDYVDYRGKTPQKTASGIFLVTAKNIRMGYIDYEASQEFIDENDYSLVMRRGIPKLGDVLITTEAPCGFVAQVDRENIALAQRVIKYRSKDSRLSNSFLKHYLLGGHFQKKLHSAATGSTVKGIKGSKLHQLTIPIPSEDEQARIVAILDKFDALTNSITEGLPREIELRQKQYEYYRDLLLSFPKSHSDEAA